VGRYVKIIDEKGVVEGVCSFIDTMMYVICCLQVNQEQVYSSYKKLYAYQFQAIMTLNEILVSCLSGIWFGKVDDWAVYIDSALPNELRNINQDVSTEEMYYLYEDLTYVLSYSIIRGYKVGIGIPLNTVLKDMNTYMLGLWVSAEHDFGQAMNLWSFNSFKHNLESSLSSVTGYFLVSVFLSNIHSHFYCNETCDWFHCDPPLLSQCLLLYIS
ncbi:hypothetical protein L873DRAFT_1724672, partial [Choiromyces venosus 120613-1]